jgi:erythromycin esterase
MNGPRFFAFAVVAWALPATLALAADFSGTVRGPDGQPVGMALVAAVAPESARPAGMKRTNAAGEFRFSGLAAGRYALTATAPGFEGTYQSPVALMEGSETRAEVRLKAGGSTLAGTVTDDSGKPVVAQVLATRIGPEEADLFVGETDAAGRLALTLPSARYTLTFLAEGFEPEDRSLDLAKVKSMSVRLSSITAVRTPAPEAVVTQVRSAAIPLATAEAGYGFGDMEPLRKVVGSARIVALGEATHGTREFFQLKHRLLEFLVSEMGFTVFAIEANWPEALVVDDYVLNGRGDPVEALRAMNFWTWDTEEVLDLILWMRRWNQDSAHTRKVRFAGVDMQFTAVAARAVRDYLAPIDPALVRPLEESFDLLLGPDPQGALQRAGLPKQEATRRALQELGAQMDARHATLAAKSSEATWRQARQHARILAQFEEMAREPAGDVRDRCMAENAAWVLDAFGPGARMVLWAHNGHVSRATGGRIGVPMGANLSRRYGKDLVVFGFAFDQGSFQAVGDGALRNFSVPAAPPWSADAMLMASGLQLFVLDLRQLPSSSPAGQWLASRRVTRSIGAVYSEAAADQYFMREVLPARYDVLAFVATTTAARPNTPASSARTLKRPPPEPAAVNLSFEDGPLAGAPKGWTTSRQAAEEGWTVLVTDRDPFEGKFAVAISRARTDAPKTFGNVLQRIDATPWRGKRIRLRAAVKADVAGTGGQAQLWMRIDRPGGKPGFFNNMDDRPIRDPEWRVYEIVGDVAEDAEAIAFGLFVLTGGKGYVDAVSLTESPGK